MTCEQIPRFTFRFQCPLQTSFCCVHLMLVGVDSNLVNRISCCSRSLLDISNWCTERCPRASHGCPGMSCIRCFGFCLRLGIQCHQIRRCTLGGFLLAFWHGCSGNCYVRCFPHPDAWCCCNCFRHNFALSQYWFVHWSDYGLCRSHRSDHCWDDCMLAYDSVALHIVRTRDVAACDEFGATPSILPRDEQKSSKGRQRCTK